MENKKNEQYNAKNIQVLEGLEAVRKRPGMYIGSISSRGLHHLVWEIMDNSIDEAMAGYASKIKITLNFDGSIEITDNGRGIPVEKHHKTGLSAVETVLTVLHAGGKFDSDSYKVSGGLHGVGASVVNALSSKLEVWIKKNNNLYYQKYINGGKPEEKLKIIGTSEENGTKIKFYPDEKIFESVEFEFETIEERIKQLAYLNKGLIIEIENQKTQYKNKYCFEKGLFQYIEELNKNKDVLIENIIYVDKEIKIKDKNNVLNNIQVEVAMQYNKSYYSNIISYANNISTVDGGTHEKGFKDALVRILNTYASKNKMFKDENEKMSREDVQEGLVAVISIKHPDPIFEGQTKGKLGNIDVSKATNKVLSGKLERFLNENPAEANLIISKALLAQRARFAARKAREATRKEDGILVGTLPGKLSDCSSKNPDECELYIVEGDSAGGSAKMGRDRKIQAILPLRGKIINVEKAKLDRIYENNEIGAMITGFGAGIGEEFNIEKLRYHKIIIMTDADVDGAHIKTLLLTFLYRYFKKLIEYGFVYIAQPPLYKIKIGNKREKYCYSDKEKNKFLKTLDPSKRFVIQRYKGLGEMDANQLWETTMNPKTRKMLQVQIQDVEKTNDIFSVLMGGDVVPRKKFINDNAINVKNIDI